MHPEKNTAPLPLAPEMQGSSQKCSAARAIRGLSPMPQKPVFTLRSTPHRRGHKVQTDMADSVLYSFLIYGLGLALEKPYSSRIAIIGFTSEGKLSGAEVAWKMDTSYFAPD